MPVHFKNILLKLENVDYVFESTRRCYVAHTLLLLKDHITNDMHSIFFVRVTILFCFANNNYITLV